ncbi:hypothetical protein MUK42_28602 [Musa troglodytarum]|uniref:Uncharacterized protein n=1 Tax=Musa troglodytarum TaxID=320322 RepID=A0A9E7FQD6_9LILI|nr:hypothetical protein MUK42_28602 [Musa troglodytarum]
MAYRCVMLSSGVGTKSSSPATKEAYKEYGSDVDWIQKISTPEIRKAESEKSKINRVDQNIQILNH